MLEFRSTPIVFGRRPSLLAAIAEHLSVQPRKDTPMTSQPSCIIVTGRQGSGKTTIARRIGEMLRMPVIIRDEIKEGYVNTFGLRHDELPPDANRTVTDLFFHLVEEYLRGRVSVVIEAAFQHHVWEPRLARIREMAQIQIVLCIISDEVAFQRPIDRGLADPEREFYHGDNRVVHYRKTGEVLSPAPYEPLRIKVNTIEVRTDDGYSPPLDQIVSLIRLARSSS
jgi:predicted kinase